MSEPRPLVTFALFTYNQQAYVAEAVEGALSQDYTPLEIIISDDASTDRTFQIALGLVRDYQGPHEIRLIRNEVNLGIGAHVTKVAKLARGELIVAAAGDDVSLPSRSAAMVAAWERNNRKPDLLCCDAERIDCEGQPAGTLGGLVGLTLADEDIARDGKLVVGALATWTKRMWTLNPELPADCVFEDHVLSLRAAMAGGIVRHPEQLVRYRFASGISSASSDSADISRLESLSLWAARRVRTLEIQTADALACGRADLVRHLERHRRELRLVSEIYRTARIPIYGYWSRTRGLRTLRAAVAAIMATKVPSVWFRAEAYLSQLRSRRP